ncbi:hypothetical protein [Kitasatospora aureofaciens]|uniref:hypothetical protein n=1 Tax=Kitasatospora aureofaciens TaxID=1894 RepID=UPI00210A2932|nr:hypothetical protein [Kitasatospora aureofaciens]
MDHRHLYLARLIRDLALPVGPVVELLAGGEDVCERAAGVLELLALGGSVEAREALRGYIREGERAAEPVSNRQGSMDPLPKHGDERDLPVLLDALERCWVEQDWCGPDVLARGLARFGAKAAGAASLLRRFWLWTPHSYERAAYLEALAAVAPAGVDEVYVECLWDCEAEARLLGVEHAPERAEVRERLAYLRDDPMEESEVREAAAVRLGGGEGS